jgi:tRNA dimethylallyltransferase
MAGLPVVVILGPTASGKTQLALDLSAYFHAEAVSADSRQVYRFMDIGTAKPAEAERAQLKHHLIDIVDPDDAFHLGDFQQRAHESIEDIRSRGRIPILVGGTGQYIWSIIEGWQVPAVAPDQDLRARMLELADRNGPYVLHDQLRNADPEAAEEIHPHNVRRVIRALELLQQTGQPPSKLRSRRNPRPDAIVFGIRVERPALYARIDARVEDMFACGLVDEVRHLLALGYDPALPAMSGIGYTQVVQYLAGEIDLAGSTSAIKAATHRLARQQSTWFRQSDSRIVWIESGEVQKAAATIKDWQPSHDTTRLLA